MQIKKKLLNQHGTLVSTYFLPDFTMRKKLRMNPWQPLREVSF